MKISGEYIKYLLDTVEDELKSLYQTYKNCLLTYPSESRPDPMISFHQIEIYEWMKSILQSVRKYYNTQVFMTIRGIDQRIDLAQAVNLVNSYGHMVKCLREITEYSDDLSAKRHWSNTLIKDQAAEKPVLNSDPIVARKELRRAKRSFARIRSSIGEMNQVSIDVSEENSRYGADLRKVVETLESLDSED